MKAIIGVVVLCGAYSLTYAASPCAYKEDGTLLPVPGECTGFFICLNGEDVLSNCGVGAHFDPITSTCIEEAKSFCVQGQFMQPNHVVQTVSCGGHEDGILLPVPGECTGFFICLNGEGVLSNCGVGAHFDPITRTCIEEAKSFCVQGQYIQPDHMAQTISCAEHKNGELMQVPGECSKFYICMADVGYLLDCGVGTHFNPVTQTCELGLASNCIDGQIEILLEEEKPEAKPAPEPEVKSEPKPESKPDSKLELKPESKPESKPEKPKAPKNICLGKAIGAFVPSKTNCNEFYVCVGSNAMLKSCKKGLHFSPGSGSCIDAELSSCIVKAPVELKEKPKQPPKAAPVVTTITAETMCLGQPNGAMFPAPGSCSKYFACLQQRAFEQNCGLRHFDPSVRTCVEPNASQCVEGEVVGSLQVVVNAVETLNVADLQLVSGNDIGDANLGIGNEGIFIGNANVEIQNTGTVLDANLVSGGSNVAAGNTDLGNSNYYQISYNGSGSQNKSIASTVDRNLIQTRNDSIGNTDLGRNNTGVFVGNANLSINNTGTISNANVVIASKDVDVGNTDLGSSNTYIISGSKIISNNRTIPIKHTGLPVNKKQVSHVENLDVAVSASGISVDVDGVGVVDANDNIKENEIGNANLGAGNSGIVIGNANVEINNTGYVSDVNLVSGTSNAVVGNTNLGYNNQVLVDATLNEKENKEVVFAIMDVNSADACTGIASGTLLPRSGSCSEFLTCEDGMAFVGKCPRGLHFNAKAKFCDWPEFAGCSLSL